MADLLPETTIAYLESNAPTSAEQARAAINKCLQEPALRAALDRMLAEEGNFSRIAVPLGAATLRIDGDIREPAATFDVQFRDGKRTHDIRVRHSISAAVVSLGKHGAFGVDAVVAVQVEGDAAAAYRMVRRLMAAISLRAFPRKSGTIDSEAEHMLEEYLHAGTKCTRANFRYFQLHMAAVGQRVIAASSRERLADIITRSKMPAKGSLSESADFRATRESASGDGTLVLLAHVNVQQCVDGLIRAYPAIFKQLRDQLKLVGLAGVRTLSSTTRIEGEGVAGTTTLRLDGRRTGLARLFEETEPAKLGCLKYAPRDSYYFACGRFDGRSIFRVIGEVGGGMVYGVAMKLHQEFGINVRKDIVEVIGPEAAIIVSSNRGVIPDVGIVVESSNAKVLENTLVRILANVRWKQGMGLVPTRLAGGQAHVLRVFNGREMELPIAPTFGVVDGRLVVTLFPISYQRFAATQRGERPSLAANRDFAKLRERVPANAQSISYMDVRRTVATLYDTFVPVLQALPQQGDVTPIFELPDAAMFTDHLYGRIGWRVADKEGMHWYSHSSVDLGPVIAGIAAATAGVAAFTRTAGDHEHEHGGAQQVTIGTLRPVRGRVEVGEKARCAQNVRDLKDVLKLYKARNKAYPESLTKAAKNWIDPKKMEVPGHPGKRYRYFGPTGRGGILVAGLPNGPDGQVCVITTNLIVKRVTPRQLHERLGHSPKNRAPKGK